MLLSAAVRRAVDLRVLVKGGALRGLVRLDDGVPLSLETSARIALGDLDDLIVECQAGHVVSPRRWARLNEDLASVLALARGGRPGVEARGPA